MSDDEELDELYDDEYEVEDILAHREEDSQTEYLIKWKGYDSIYNTWEPEKNIISAKSLLDDYYVRLTQGSSQKKPEASTETTPSPSSSEISIYGEDSITIHEIESDSSISSIDKTTVVKKERKSAKRGRGRSRKDTGKTTTPSSKAASSRRPQPVKKSKKNYVSEDSDSTIDDYKKTYPPSQIQRFEDVPSDQVFEDGYDRLILNWGTSSNKLVTIVDDTFAPKGDWDSLAKQVLGVFGPVLDSLDLSGLLYWKNGTYSMHEMSTLRVRCPQLLLKYYEEHLNFDPVK